MYEIQQHFFFLSFNFIKKKNRSEHISFVWQHMVYIDTLNQSKYRIWYCELWQNFISIERQYKVNIEWLNNSKCIRNMLNWADSIAFNSRFYTHYHTQSCTSTKAHVRFYRTSFRFGCMPTAKKRVLHPLD